MVASQSPLPADPREAFAIRRNLEEPRGPTGRMIEWSAMDFFFVRDYRRRPRFFSAGPLGPLPANFSKTRTAWEAAKKKVTSLSPRILLQEQAFEHGGRAGQGPLRILHSGRHDDKSVRTRLHLFLERQKTRHIIVLAGEALLVPITGLAALLPGPNVLFYALADPHGHPMAGPSRHRPRPSPGARARRRPAPRGVGSGRRGPRRSPLPRASGPSRGGPRPPVPPASCSGNKAN